MSARNLFAVVQDNPVDVFLVVDNPVDSAAQLQFASQFTKSPHQVFEN